MNTPSRAHRDGGFTWLQIQRIIISVIRPLCFKQDINLSAGFAFKLHPDFSFTVKASYNQREAMRSSGGYENASQQPGGKKTPRALHAWRFSLKQCLFISVAAAVRALAYQSVISHRKWLQQETEGKLGGGSPGQRSTTHFLCVFLDLRA